MSDDNTKTSAPEKRGKMASASADEQLKFLLSCIRYSVNGKVDFTEVASECSIISKGAAAKRYERLMKAHNIDKKPEISPRDASVASAKVRKGEAKPSGSAAAANKKRKLIEAENPNNDKEDDEEPMPAMKKKKGVKKENGVKQETSVKAEVKEEAAAEGEAGVPQYDGGGDDCRMVKADEHAAAIKSEPGVIVKSEPVCEATAGKHVLTIEDDSVFDQFLQPDNFDRSIVIAD